MGAFVARRRLRRILAGSVALVAVTAALTAAPSRADGGGANWASGLPGCAPDRPAVAHHAGQDVLAPQPDDGPVPCGVLTGWPAAESRIEVTDKNTLIFNPAKMDVVPGVGGLGEGLARSFDDGASWDAVKVPVFPGSDAYPLQSSGDNNIYVDHQTGRLFAYFYNPLGAPPVCGPGGGTTAYSTTEGTTWVVARDIDHGCSENPTLVTGEPTMTSPLDMSYENVAYLCGDNTSSGVGAAGTPGFSCSKSIDGGRTWKGTTKDGQGFYSGVVKDNTDPYPECAGASSSAGAGVQPMPDGTLVVLVTCNAKSYLSESADEGGHWKIASEIPHNGTLRIDSDGNLYVARLATVDGKPELLLSHAVVESSSADGWVWHAWTPELDMTAPGVTAIGKWFLVQGTHGPGQVGHVAVAYFATQQGRTGFDGIITETREALDSDPVFWSGQVNDPGRPLLYNTANENAPFVNNLDFVGGALSPDGRSAWGAFYRSCGEDWSASASCQQRWPQTNPGSPTDGFAGRLVWRHATR